MPIRFHCPKCNQRMKIDERHVGKLVGCPSCLTKCRVPDPNQTLDAIPAFVDEDEPATPPPPEPQKKSPSKKAPSKPVSSKSRKELREELRRKAAEAEAEQEARKRERARAEDAAPPKEDRDESRARRETVFRSPSKLEPIVFQSLPDDEAPEEPEPPPPEFASEVDEDADLEEDRRSPNSGGRGSRRAEIDEDPAFPADDDAEPEERISDLGGRGSRRAAFDDDLVFPTEDHAEPEARGSDSGAQGSRQAAFDDDPAFPTEDDPEPEGRGPDLGGRGSRRAVVDDDPAFSADDDSEPWVEPPVEPSLAKSGFSVDQEELIDMTAMVDIVFFLLIFFLVTSMHAIDSAIHMPNPDPQQGAGPSAAEPDSLEQFETDDDYIVVHIDRNNVIDIDGVQLPDVQDLVRKIRDLKDAAPHPTKMLVVGDGDSSHGTMVSVLDAGHEAGLERVRMAVGGAVEDE